MYQIMHSNVSNFLECKCVKLSGVDPKDFNLVLGIPGMYDHVWGNVCHVNTYEREFDEGISRLMGEFDNLRTHLREHTRTYTRECDYVCFFLVFFCRKFDNLIIHFRDICTWYSHMYKKLVYLYLKKEKEENRFSEIPDMSSMRWIHLREHTRVFPETCCEIENPSQGTHILKYIREQVQWDALICNQWDEYISENTHTHIYKIFVDSLRCMTHDMYMES